MVYTVFHSSHPMQYRRAGSIQKKRKQSTIVYYDRVLSFAFQNE